MNKTLDELLTGLADVLGYDVIPKESSQDRIKEMRATLAVFDNEQLSDILSQTQAQLQAYMSKWREILVSAGIASNRMSEMMDKDRPQELVEMKLWLDALVAESKSRQQDPESKRCYKVFSEWCLDQARKGQ